MSFACTAAVQLVSWFVRSRGGWRLRASRWNPARVAAERGGTWHRCRGARPPPLSSPTARRPAWWPSARPGRAHAASMRCASAGGTAGRRRGLWVCRARSMRASRHLPHHASTRALLPRFCSALAAQSIRKIARRSSWCCSRRRRRLPPASPALHHPPRPCAAHPPAPQVSYPMRNVVAKAMTVRGRPSCTHGPGFACPHARARHSTARRAGRLPVGGPASPALPHPLPHACLPAEPGGGDCQHRCHHPGLHPAAEARQAGAGPPCRALLAASGGGSRREEGGCSLQGEATFTCLLPLALRTQTQPPCPALPPGPHPPCRWRSARAAPA